MHSTLQVIDSSALVHSCWNHEVTTFIICAHYYQVYFQITDTFNDLGSIYLCRVVGMVARYDIRHEYYILSSILSDT